MKTHRWFSRNRFVPHLRIASVVTLMSAAAAMAFVAVNPSGPMSLGKSANTDQPNNKFTQDRDESFDNKVTRPGISRDKGPAAAALQKLQLSAYPAADVSSEATLNAIASFKKVKAQAAAAPPAGNPPGQWQLIGPSNSVQPGILSFSGAQYITSGRITALAIAPSCTNGKCRVYVAAAGGGVWRTDTALGTPTWTFLSGSFGTNAIGSLLLDPNDSKGDTIYAGTGEPNASGDSEAGVGIYKSTDGGNTWALVPGSDIFFQRAIGQMAFDKNGNLLVPIASAIRGISSVTSDGTSSGTADHPLPPRGLYRQTGNTFTRIFTAPAPTRGSTTVKLDPTHLDIIYVNAFGGGSVAGDGGIWRSTDNGATPFTQIFAPKDTNPVAAANAIERDEFDVTTLPNGATRMYVGAGTFNSPVNGDTTAATFWRSDDVSSATIAPFASFGGNQVLNYCTGQCWYDNVVFTPKGHPDIVYLGGSFLYGELNTVSNARGVLLSRNAGVDWTDQTRDGTTGAPAAGSCCNSTAVAGNSIHPDQHAIVVNPNNPLQFFEGSDGGIVRSTGTLSNISSQCAARGLTGDPLTYCRGLLSAVPSQIFSLNTGLSTLQFQSLSVAADNAQHVQGGTQDNGTFDNNSGSTTTWPQIIYGDGGQSGFSATNSSRRFNTFTGQANDANFQNGDPSKWVIISAPIISSPEAAYFYPPIIADPHPSNAGTIFQGSFSVWRTQDWGGDQAFLEANCPEFTSPADKPGCGDFVQIGTGSGKDLTSSVWGDRAGGAIAWLQRTTQNTGTLWAATGIGRIFVSDNADSATASVGWTRLDKKHTNDPPRAISAIYIDPTNPHHAWVSYNGYNINTPATPGHVFEVNWDGTSSSSAATWTDISYNLPDFPITALVRDDVTGDLYAGSDFTVMRLPNGSTTWSMAGTGLPMVEVPGLTIVPSARILYAATHGRSAWALALP